jgi:hypothetical protein
LHFALSFVSENEVDKNIVILSLKPIFDPDNLEDVRRLSMNIVNDFQDLDELHFRARAFTSHHVAYLESY